MSNTRLTVADARVTLEKYGPSAAAFLSYLNQVCERLIYSGKWKGAVIKTTFDSSAGFITLPPEYLSVLGMTYNNWPGPIFGEFHTYFESGPGTPLEASGWLGQLQDMGDGFCSQKDIIEANPRAAPAVVAQPGAIVLYSTGSDNGKVVRIFGIEQETGEPVTDPDGELGENITLNAPSVQSTKHYSKLTDVIKAPTNGPVRAWVLPSSGAATYQIASWLPGETRPRYRRYRTGKFEHAIQILCQRRFMPARVETDWVIPGNLAALKFGIKAMRLEDTGYEDKATSLWDTATKWLNDEATASRGGAQPSIPVGVWGWGDTIPQTH
jgi:hypothetical protein